MNRGFYVVMLAQFFSSLADNALFVVAIELLIIQNAPAWQGTALVSVFAFFYVILAPFVGVFADTLPKGRVMFISNSIKIIGCSLIFFGINPLVAYTVVGLGAALYSPAKYGILTELLPPSKLVKANGWIEGLTIASIVLGILLGGQLVNLKIFENLPKYFHGQNGITLFLIVIYLLASIFNLEIPRTKAKLINNWNKNFSIFTNLQNLFVEFFDCNKKMWQDKLGQVAIASTTLIWGVSGNLKYLIIAWAILTFNYSTSQASNLVGVLVIGTVIGAMVATKKFKLFRTTRVLPFGIILGILLSASFLVKNIYVALSYLTILGFLGGYLVVPMNSLIQHRGHELMGAGRSIAVQNFNEQLCILFLGGFCTLATKFGLSPYLITFIFGVLIALLMSMIYFWNKFNYKNNSYEVRILLHKAK